ncbi:7460_t:CDS:2, partial [Cetraspora pellucida]
MIEEVEQEKVSEIWKVHDTSMMIQRHSPRCVKSTREYSFYKRNLYGRVWGLARIATLLAVEQDDDEITTFLQDYIRRKLNEYMQERPAIDESSAIDERPVIRERPLAAINDEIPNNAHEINEYNINADSESNEIEEEIEEKIEQENEITNLNNMKNPNKVTGR